MRPRRTLHRRSYTRREALGLGASGLAAALMLACNEDDDEPSSTATASPIASLLAPDGTPPARESGALRMGVRGEAEVPLALTYARLVAVDPRTATVHGDLAFAVEQVDPLLVRFRLRPDAFFHLASDEARAQSIEAADVVRDFAVRAGAGEYLFTEVVDSVEAAGSGTVLLRLRGPFALLFEFLGDPRAAAIRAAAPSPLGLPLGSGPFVPERREDGGLSLLAHPLYHHLGLPLLDEVRIVTAEREQALDAAFESGALDVRTHGGEQSLARAAERADASTLSRSSRRIRGIGLSLVGTRANGASVRFQPAFQDARVRRALSLSLDREAIAALDGGLPSGPVGPGHAADALPADELAAHPLYQHDPAEAAKLLDAAGVAPLGFLVEAPRRQPLREITQTIARNLRGTSFAPQLELVTNEQWEQDLVAGDFEAIVFELEPARTPDLGLRLHTSSGLNGAFSPWGYSNPVYDEAVRSALSALDPAERAERSREAQRLLLEDVPAMFPLPEPVDQISIANALGGFEYDAYEFNDGWLAPRWHLGASTSAPAPPRRPAPRDSIDG